MNTQTLKLTYKHFQQIEVIVGPVDFERYQKFHYLSSIRTEPTIRWCPTVDCGNPVHGDPSAAGFPVLTCNKCNTQFCYECNQLV